MSNFRDPAYLATQQYKDPSNLNARIQLHERFSTNPYGWFNWVFDQLEMPASAQVLEVGCGSGFLWSTNLSKIPIGWQVILSDISPGMLIGCRTTLAPKLDQFYFEVCNAMDIPFSSGRFDGIIANHMLYHLPDRGLALAEITRVLKPGGTFFATTNGKTHLLEMDTLIAQNCPTTEGMIPLNRASTFTLENGEDQLAPWFTQVERRLYQDSLEVTEAGPLVAYIRSMIPPDGEQGVSSSSLRLELVIRERIEREGYFRIQKSSGIFIGKL